MADQELTLSGARADYTIEPMPFNGSWVPVLVGVGPFNNGDIHVLQGISVLAFSDGRLMLGETGMAQANAAPVSQGVGSFRPLLDWVLSEQPPEDVQGNWSLPDWLMGRMGAPGASVESTQQNSPVDRAWAKDGAGSPAARPTVDPVSAPVGGLEAPSLGSGGASALANSPAVNRVTSSDAEVFALLDPELESTNTAGRSNAGPLAGSGLIAPLAGTEKIVNEIWGTVGPDQLWGTEGHDTIDGLYNTQASGSVFFESMFGLGGDDRLIYRGFGGDPSLTDVRAQLDGGSGDDVFEVFLDGRTFITLADESGHDGLVVQTPLGVSSPWASNFLSWQWDWTSGSPLLQASYVAVDSENGGLGETNPGLDWISSGSTNATLLVRPTSGEAVLKGTSASDWLLADVSTRQIDAGGGNDVVLAKAGVTVALGAGINTLYADSQDITLSYEDSPFSVRVNLANRLGLVFDEDANLYAIDRLMNAPLSVIGSEHADELVGDAGNNTLQTGGGADRLLGGGGADHFIIDVHNTTKAVSIVDWNVVEGDRLTLNLSDPSGDVLIYTQFELLNEQQEMLWSRSIGNSTEEGALLSLMVSDASDTLYWADDLAQPQAWVTFGVPIDSMTAEQWASVLSVDYL